MPLFKEGRPVEDAWTVLNDEDALPAEGPVMVSLSRFLADAESLAQCAGEIGVLLQPADDPAALVPYFERLDLIAVNFPRFADGRGYSTAHVLRARYGWRGELRAVGDVLRDQIAFMARCGFDALMVKNADAAGIETSLHAITDTYQTATDRAAPVWRRRVAHAALSVAAE